MRKNVVRVIPSKEVRENVTFCDICESEVLLPELPIEYSSYDEAGTSRIHRYGWQYLFRRRVEDEVKDNPLMNVEDFDVHYECAVKAIAGAVKERYS